MKGTKDRKKSNQQQIERIQADQNGSSLPARQSTKQSARAMRSTLARSRSVLIRSHPLDPLLIAFDLPFMFFVPFRLFRFRAFGKACRTSASCREARLSYNSLENSVAPRSYSR